MILLGISQLVAGGFIFSLGALITPMSLEFGVDVSTASLGITMASAVYCLSVLLVNIALEKNYIGPK